MTTAREQWAEQLDAALAGERVTARYFPQRLAPGERGGHERRALAVAPPHLIIFRITPKRTTTGKLNWDDPELETTAP